MQVKASHILVKSLAEAVNLQEQIKTGSDFGVLASQHSMCPSKHRGGDLGFFSRGQMVKPFEEAAFNNPVGSVVGPVQTQFGYHLVKRTA